MTKKLILDLISARFGPYLVRKIFFWGGLPLPAVKNSCKISLYVNSRKTSESNSKKWQKTQFLAQFWPLLAQIWAQENFFMDFTSNRF